MGRKFRPQQWLKCRFYFVPPKGFNELFKQSNHPNHPLITGIIISFVLLIQSSGTSKPTQNWKTCWAVQSTSCQAVCSNLIWKLKVQSSFFAVSSSQTQTQNQSFPRMWNGPFPILRYGLFSEPVKLRKWSERYKGLLIKKIIHTERKPHEHISPVLIPLSSSCFLAEALLGLPLPRLLWSEWLLDLDLLRFSKSLFTAEFIFSRLTLSVRLLLASLLLSVQMNRDGMI